MARDIAVEALASERSQFDPELPGLPDRRSGVSGPGMTTAWCYGVPGIGIVRLAVLNSYP